MLVLMGGSLMATGLMLAWGGMSGRLAAMLAALFAPSALAGGAGSSSGSPAPYSPYNGLIPNLLPKLA